MSSWRAFDLETWGRKPEYALQPRRAMLCQSWITVIAHASKQGAHAEWANPATLRTYLSDFLLESAENNTVLVGWNVLFDVAWLLAYGMQTEVSRCRWLDGMLLWKRLSPFEPRYGLKQAVSIHMPKYAGYEADVNYGAESCADIKKLMTYAKADVTFTLALAKKFWKQLDQRAQRAATIEAMCIPPVAQSWINGITIDQEAHAELSRDTAQTLEESLADIDLDEETIASPAKLSKVFYVERGYEPEVLTPKGAPSTNKEAVTKLALKHVELKPLLKAREAMTTRNKFVNGVANSLAYNEGKKVYPAPRIGGTYTGRLTYSSKQNI